MPRMTMWALKGPPEGTFFPPDPEDLSELLILLKKIVRKVPTSHVP